MIIAGNSRRNARWFTTHIQRTDQDQRVSIAEVRGLAGDTIAGWFAQMEAMAISARGDNYFYHSNIDPRADEHLTEAEWEHAVDTLERNLGLEGQPRFVVEHEKEGRTHRHVFWARADMDSNTLIRDSHNYDIHMRTADQLEEEFGHEPTPRGRGPEGRNPKNYEVFRAKDSGIDPYDVGALFRQLWERADSGPAFAAALEENGFILARGRRGYIAVDAEGDDHSLARRLGIKMRDVNVRMKDVDIDQLPTVAEARALARERARSEDRDGAQRADQDKHRDAVATVYELLAEELGEAVRDAIKNKDNGKERSKDEESPPEAEAGPSQATESASPGPEPPKDGPSAAPSDPPPERGASAGAREAAADLEPPHTRPAAAPAPAAAPQPTLFERLAEKLSQAVHAPGGGPTVAEAADLTAPRAPPSHDGVPLTPWEIPSPDRTAPASTATPFERIAQELVRDAQQAVPVLENLAVVATAIAEHEPPSEFERLAQELTHEAEPVAHLPTEPTLDAFERITQARTEALRRAGGDGLFFTEGLAWTAGRIAPTSDPLPEDRDPTPFERIVQETNLALRSNGGEPYSPGGESFWSRTIARLREARDRAFEWVTDRITSFAERVSRSRNTPEHESERER